MSGVKSVKFLRNAAIASAMLVGSIPAIANDNAGTAMTAGVIMEKMKPGERFTYVSGLIEGLAYARFLKDSTAKGVNDQEGMDCINRWFFDGTTATMDQIENAFNKYHEHYPSVVIFALIKRKCGE